MSKKQFVAPAESIREHNRLAKFNGETAMSEAREHARQKALQAIKAAGEKDWRANAEWLRLSFPADYRGSANKIEVNATAGASSFVVTVEKQRELQERRCAALESLRRPNES